jgi:hypothetical protein
MIKIHVNQNFKDCEEAFRGIPDGTLAPTRVFRNARNFVFLVKVNGKFFVVKKFHSPTFFNRVMNTFFRKDRSRRTYENGIGLLFLGIPTAKPVGYIKEYRCGIYKCGYLITEYLPYERLDEMYDSLETKEERIRLLEEYIAFYKRIIGLGIHHPDYNPGNILVKRTVCGYSFFLIDINRLKFNQKLTREQIERGYRQLGINMEKNKDEIREVKQLAMSAIPQYAM